ncbi:MAG: transcription factor [Candidatus Diapherotrites archaeon CG10_big_fil_rev_8_21_14_0_10_31_34]|nr:MAG: transcription factor [Candidatus Diapherotrites archaeon CG10_big_fil_rev_8_21_14_0_10_31_34]
MAKKDILSNEMTKSFIIRVGGNDALSLIKVCESKNRKVTDEEVAKKTKLKITEVRAILNRLHYRGIACYDKKKNNQTGWYSYTWEIKTRRIAELIIEEQSEEIKKLEKKLEFEKDYVFFSCKTNCGNVPFEVAAEYQFRCPKCGKPMDVVNNKKRIKDIKKQLIVVELALKKLSN